MLQIIFSLYLVYSWKSYLPNIFNGYLPRRTSTTSTTTTTTTTTETPEVYSTSYYRTTTTTTLVTATTQYITRNGTVRTTSFPASTYITRTHLKSSLIPCAYYWPLGYAPYNKRDRPRTELADFFINRRPPITTTSFFHTTITTTYVTPTTQYITRNGTVAKTSFPASVYFSSPHLTSTIYTIQRVR